MSVYKAVSNYFVDILDFLNTKEKKYKTLDKYFEKITAEEKRELMIKLSDTMLRINMLFVARQDYWKGRLKEQKAIYAIFITIAVIIGIIFLVIFIARVKKETTFQGPSGMFKKSKTAITYITIYMVILTVFVTMIMNAKALGKMFVEEGKKARREGEKYLQYMFKDSASIERPLFQLAIAARGKMLFSPEMLENANILSNTCGNQASQREQINQSMQFYDCATGKVDFEGAYDSMRVHLSKALTSFYSVKDGKDGYTRVRQDYIISSPVPMMKETSRIMKAYYNLALKDNHIKTDVTSSEEQIKALLTETVVTPVSKVLYNMYDPASFDKSMQNPTFASNIKTVSSLFAYMAAYAYMVYIQKPSSDVGFDPVIKLTLDTTYEFSETFGNFSSTDFAEYIDSTKDPVQLTQSLIGKSVFVDLFKKYYEELRNYTVGDSYFLYDTYEIEKRFYGELNKLPFNEAYKVFIKEALFNQIITPLQLQLSSMQVLIGNEVEKAATTLTAYNINIRKYNDFLMSELTKGKDAVSKADMISDALSQLYKSLAIKRQLKGTNVGLDKYLEQSEFDKFIDGMRFTELESMLEVDHLSFIVYEFYKKFSDSIVREDKTSENLYVSTKKNFKLWETVVAMTSTTLALAWSNFAISNVMLYPYLYVDLQKKIEEKQVAIEALRVLVNGKLQGDQKDKAEQEKKTQVYELELLFREKRNRTMNWYIRMFIPFFVLVFVMCLLVAMYKKAVATHEFNVDMIESNTYSLKTASEELMDQVKTLGSMVSDKSKKISDIYDITSDQKKELYSNIKLIIDKYEKCNFILESQKSKLPFPYSDLAMNGFMIFVTVLCIIYVYSRMKPIARLKQIKELNKMKEEASVADKRYIKMLKRDLEYQLACHEDDIDAVIFTLKVVFFIFIITFLIFYSSKVVTSTSEYKMGLFNSGYFETGSCVA